MGKNSKALIIFEEILMLAVVAFTVWGAIKGAYVALIVTVLALGAMYRQYRVLISLRNDNNSEDQDEGDEEDE